MPALIASKTLLADARLAYHRLQTGVSARVVVDQNGERVEFTSINKATLYSYILMLEASLATGCNGTPRVVPALHPAGFTF